MSHLSLIENELGCVILPTHVCDIFYSISLYSDMASKQGQYFFLFFSFCLKNKEINNTNEYNHYRIPHNIFPLKSREMVVFVLINLSTYHYWQGKKTYQYTDKQPTSKTNVVSLVQFKYILHHTSLFVIHSGLHFLYPHFLTDGEKFFGSCLALLSVLLKLIELIHLLIGFLLTYT